MKISSAVIVVLAAYANVGSARKEDIAGSTNNHRDLKYSASKGGKSTNGSGGSKGCFENLGFQFLSKLQTGDLIDTCPHPRGICNRYNYFRGRLLEETNEKEGRRLGANSREACMDLGGFPLYYNIDGGQKYLGCVPACDVYPHQYLLDEYCTPVSGGKTCSKLHENWKGFSIGFGKNPTSGETFFAYCCEDSDLVHFEVPELVVPPTRRPVYEPTPVPGSPTQSP